MRLDKQIGHFTCTAAVIGKKMGLCSENISPGHGSQMGCFDDTLMYVLQTIYVKPLFFGVFLDLPQSLGDNRTLGEVLQIHLHSQILALGQNRL